MSRLAPALLIAGALVGQAIPAPALAGDDGSARRADIFDTVSFVSSDLSALAQWNAALERIEDEAQAVKRCDLDSTTCPSMRSVVWRAKVASLPGQSPDGQLWEINRFVNDLVRSAGHCGLPGPGEAWPTPLEAVEKGGGALTGATLKYASLREAGWPASALRIAVVKDVLRNCLTAVMIATIDRKSYLLDDISTVVRATDRVNHLIPYYSFNESARWVHVTPRQETAP